jgi:prepilin-type N-terminal cleavage/methylation domain-containing protein
MAVPTARVAGRARTHGFTLVETLVALVLSSVLLVLVSTTFLVQNQFYSEQVLVSSVHDNARATTELVAGELRSLKHLGLVVAGARTLKLRSSMAIAVVCGRSTFSSGSIDILTEGGEAELDTDEVAGLALLNQSTGVWDYHSASWATLNGSSAFSANRCYTNGADTTGVRDDFHRLTNVATLLGSTPSIGDVVMLYRETQFTIDDSALDTMELALYRKTSFGSAIEFATGMDSTAQFKYRVGGTYVDTVSAGSLASVDAVRVIADARRRSTSGGRPDVTFGWSADIALREP